MKKQMIFLTVLSALACMTGCGTNTPSATADITTTAAQTTTEITTPAPAESTEITSEQNVQTTVSESATQTSRTETEKQETTTQAQPLKDFSAIAGEWIRDDAVYANCYLSIDAAGKFTVVNIKGERFGGTVTSENGAYSLYKADGSLWNSFSDQKSGSSKRLVSKKNTDTSARPMTIKYQGMTY